MRAASILALSWALIAVLPGCGLLSSRRPEEPSPPADSDLTLGIQSHHWSDIIIYLVNENQSQRLGMVAGVSTIQFAFAYRQLATGGKIRLRAHPVGGQGSFASKDVLVQSGQWLRWTLESDLKRSPPGSVSY